MKRISNIYSEIYELKNLYLAYYKASKGKKKKIAVTEFTKYLDYNIKNIQEELIEEKVSIGNYTYFKIYDPKERLICAASFKERVLHHAIMNILDKYFEDFLIYDSYACRKNKGLHKAVNRAFFFAKKNEYYIKMDIRKYFDSIDHNILYELLTKKFKDKKLLNLLQCIIKSYSVSYNKGIPIGNLTSQYFANFYLNLLDRFIKEELKIKPYIRYMDDFLIMGNDLEQLSIFKNKIKIFLKNRLDLVLKPPITNNIKKGIPFLGFSITNKKILLSRRSKMRFKNKLLIYEKKYYNNKWSINELVQHTVALTGFTKIANSKGWRNFIINRYGIYYN